MRRPAGIYLHPPLSPRHLLGRAEPVNLLLTLAILFTTVLACLGLGIVASYMLLNGILVVFGQHSRKLPAGPQLIESPASGD